MKSTINRPIDRDINYLYGESEGMAMCMVCPSGGIVSHFVLDKAIVPCDISQKHYVKPQLIASPPLKILLDGGNM